MSALAAREQAARQQGDLLSFEDTRLILVVDQLEELFTLGEVTPDQRKAFILCLKGLMDSGRMLVVATIRSDYWHRAAEVPLLVALSEGRGRLDLLAPTQAEITEMIRRPAEVAGLSFETDPRTEIPARCGTGRRSRARARGVAAALIPPRCALCRGCRGEPGLDAALRLDAGARRSQGRDRDAGRGCLYGAAG